MTENTESVRSTDNPQPSPGHKPLPPAVHERVQAILERAVRRILEEERLAAAAEEAPKGDRDK